MWNSPEPTITLSIAQRLVGSRVALEVPGYVALYQSRPDFAGMDALTLEVKFPGGRTEIQKITVTVGAPSTGQGV